MYEFLINISEFSIQWSPFLPLPVVGGMALFALVLFGISLVKSKKGTLLRLIIAGLFLLAIGNPILVKEKREATKDTAVLVVDQSPSQTFGDRAGRTAKAAKYISSEIRSIEDLNLRVVEVSGARDKLTTRTDLFESLRKALADVPVSQRAGVVMITDGQVHDVPSLNNYETDEAFHEEFGPLHVLLSGSKDDKDRHLKIEKAPAYGIVGQDVKIQYRIQDTDNIQSNGVAQVTIRRANGQDETLMQPVDETISIDLPVEHAGQNVYEIEVRTVDGELTGVNNKTAVLVNGVRDRLKVLLISGKPHAGERAWRNILTSDPAVDLVHFTIMREPHKLNNVPQDELSLIPFPFRELFEVKIYDFDLIIFDRYRANRIMPKYYFGNIAKYVRQGGALLEASGPAFASGQSIFDTALGQILPSIPTGEMIEQPFKPALTEIGGRHPVTKDLNWKAGTDWGDWLRQVSVVPKQGDIVMKGIQENPLLILKRVEDGRVAHLTSDLIWLWARGYDGGGPQADLLRRLSHWLMKEPELEENALDVNVNGNNIVIRRRSLEAQSREIKMILPDGNEKYLDLDLEASGWASTTIRAEQLGIYKFQDEELRRVALVGEYNPPELQAVITTDENLMPVIDASQGSLSWLIEGGEPYIRHMTSNSSFSGFGWIGLRKNGDFTVTGVTSKTLFPDILALFVLAGFLVFGWWREGKTS